MQKIYPDQPRTVSGAQFPMGQGHIPGQPVHVPTEHPVHVPTEHPVHVPTEHPVHVLTGQPVHDPTRQPAQSVPGPGVPMQPPVNQPREGRLDRTYMKTLLSASRLVEFIALLIAWPCGVVYSNRTFGVDGRATFFAGVSTFCWVMVIVLQIVLMFGIHKDRRYFRTPSNSTLIVIAVHVLMTILLIASTTSLIMVGVELFKADQAHRDLYGEGKPYDENNVFLGFALLTGGATCFMFLDDIPPLTRMYRLQRAKEIAAADDSQ